MLRELRRIVVVSSLFLAALLAIGRDASAQSSAAAVPVSRGLEFGASSGVLTIFPTFGVRLAAPLTPNLAVEGTAEIVPWVIDDTGARYQLFQGQLRHTFSRRPRWTWHATYGATFLTEYEHTAARTGRLPDGTAFVLPEERRFALETAAVHAGIGGERAISRRVAVRWDAQLLIALDRTTVPAPRGVFGITWR
jgi:hypothetical protein